MYQSLPSVTIPPGNPAVNLQNLAIPSHPGKFFLSNAQPSDFLGNLYFSKFYSFSTSFKISIIRIVYKFLRRTYVCQLKIICENHKSLN